MMVAMIQHIQSLQYFGAIIPAAQLDELVNNIPLSNPLYNLGSATEIISINSEHSIHRVSNLD